MIQVVTIQFDPCPPQTYSTLVACMLEARSRWKPYSNHTNCMSDGAFPTPSISSLPLLAVKLGHAWLAVDLAWPSVPSLAAFKGRLNGQATEVEANGRSRLEKIGIARPRGMRLTMAPRRQIQWPLEQNWVYQQRSCCICSRGMMP